MKTLIVGPSHVKRWQSAVDSGAVPAVDSIELFGGGGWPLFSKKIKEKVSQDYGRVDQVFMMVPDFRIGNEAVHYIGSDILFSNRYKFIEKGLISCCNDVALYNHAIKCLDWYIEKYGAKIKFCFWCLFFREQINVSSGRHVNKGHYAHPIWNYNDLVKRYPNNVIDLTIIKSEYSDFILCDGTVHPSEKGYAFLSWLATRTVRNLSLDQIPRSIDGFYYGAGM